MKLQLDVPTTWTVGPPGEGPRRYVLPGGAGVADVVVVIRESLPLPIELWGWPQAALGRLNTALFTALPTELAAVGAAAAAKRRVQVQNLTALATITGWPASVVHATLLDEREQPIAGCTAALYRFLAYAAEVLIVCSDRARLTTLREPLLGVLATGRAVWPPGEPPSLHHMLHDEPNIP